MSLLTRVGFLNHCHMKPLAHFCCFTYIVLNIIFSVNERKAKQPEFLIFGEEAQKRAIFVEGVQTK